MLYIHLVHQQTHLVWQKKSDEQLAIIWQQSLTNFSFVGRKLAKFGKTANKNMQI
jgi:hypothetical protein